MNTFLQKIWDNSLKNDQSKEYIDLCIAAINRKSIDGYTEKHHILPKCICESDIEKKDKENLVVFTAKEHFIAHRLLSEMFDGYIKRKMLYALSALSFKKDGGRILSEDEYAITKEASRKAKKGIPLSESHRQKIRESFAKHNPNKGRKTSEETKQKQSLAKKGKPHYHSIETRKKLSESRIGLVINDVTCVHCGKIGKPGPLGKWHFNNCKLRSN
jgi:hypothetical protein